MRKRSWNVCSAWVVAACLTGCVAAGCSDTAAVQTNMGENTAVIAQETAGQREAAWDDTAVVQEAAALDGAAAEGLLEVTFLDVGQGNTVLVESEGKYMLIDGGDREYSSFVVSYLEQAGVEELAYVISSHYDADHLNGVVGVLNVFPCETVLAADYVTDTRVYESFQRVVDEKDITLVYPSVGDTYVLGDAEFTIVCPDSYTYADANDNSVGIRLTHGSSSFLICGDAGVKSERAMLESGVTLKSDVYLASHHGSDGSSSLEFLQAVSPEAVVFSVGADNSYGHPSERVLSDVQSLGAEIYRTDVCGAIVVTSDGQTLSWNVGASAEPTQTQMASENQAAQENIQTDTAEEAFSEGNVSAASAGETVQETYVLNRNTKKFHKPSCSSASDISEENRADFTGTRQELLDAGYEPCKRCEP